MNFTDKNVDISNDLRKVIQRRTKTIDDGESVAIMLLWSFFKDHAECHGLDVEWLAREQLDAFIEYARKNLDIVRQRH
jgi:hypothetical protein